MTRVEETMAETEQDRFERNLYRSVFTSPKGKKVLAMILADLGMFEKSKTEAQFALKNYAITLMEHIGCFHEENLEGITGALLSVNPYTPINEEAENRGGKE